MPGAGEGAVGSQCLMGTVSAWENEGLEMDGGDVNALNATELYALNG